MNGLRRLSSYAIPTVDTAFKHMTKDPKIALSFLNSFSDEEIISAANIAPTNIENPSVVEQLCTPPSEKDNVTEIDWRCFNNKGEDFITKVMIERTNHSENRTLHRLSSAVHFYRKPVYMINILAHSAQLMEDYQFERHYKFLDTTTMIPLGMETQGAQKTTSSLSPLPAMRLYQCELPHVTMDLDDIKNASKRSWLALLCGVTPVNVLTAGVMQRIVYRGKGTPVEVMDAYHRLELGTWSSEMLVQYRRELDLLFKSFQPAQEKLKKSYFPPKSVPQFPHSSVPQGQSLVSELSSAMETKTLADVAKNLLCIGFPHRDIASITGLPLEEIHKLADRVVDTDEFWSMN